MATAQSNATNTHTDAKRIPDISVDVMATGQITISFADGKFLELKLESLNPQIRSAAMLHGLKQKLVDAAAIARDTTTGRSATINDKYMAVREVFNRITAADGTWNKPRSEGEGSASGGGLLASALMELKGIDRATAMTFLAARTNEEKAALRKNQTIAVIIARLQSRNAPSKIDADALLGALGMDLPQSEPDADAPFVVADPTQEPSDKELVAALTAPLPKPKAVPAAKATKPNTMARIEKRTIVRDGKKVQVQA